MTRISPYIPLNVPLKYGQAIKWWKVMISPSTAPLQPESLTSLFLSLKHTVRTLRLTALPMRSVNDTKQAKWRQYHQFHFHASTTTAAVNIILQAGTVTHMRAIHVLAMVTHPWQPAGRLRSRRWAGRRVATAYCVGLQARSRALPMP